MRYYTGLSSEIYKIDPRDLAVLKDTAKDVKPIKGEGVVLLIGDSLKDTKDTVYQGREVIEKAIKDGVEYIPVRVAFYTRTPWFNILSSFVKGVRKHYFGYSSNNYHMRMKDLEDLKIERSVRTIDNAYTFKSQRKWVVGEDIKDEWFAKMSKSFKEKGYDDRYPMDVMLCRAFGVKDNLHQGHHRMMFSREYGVERVAIKFMAAGHLPKWLSPIFKFLIKVTKYKTN
ncbi:MAG: hypothetical protein LBL47_03975 [Lactobacillus sp.]|jgi:hypothetical protein|nr:hypothetical protein [Lactobacillus sp.]